MRIDLDCSGWADAATAWEALLGALDAPEWHGRNLDALWDGLTGGLLTPQRPLEIVVRGVPTPEVRTLLRQIGSILAEARRQGQNVTLTLDPPGPAPARF